jgi:hypothetical protein
MEVQIMNDYAEILEGGDVLLRPGKLVNANFPSGLLPTLVILPCMGVRWFVDFLFDKERESDNYSTDGKEYQAHRDADGVVFLEEVRDGRFCNVIGYSREEIPAALAELRNISQDEKPTE